jgi:hypothetical protein
VVTGKMEGHSNPLHPASGLQTHAWLNPLLTRQSAPSKLGHYQLKPFQHYIEGHPKLGRLTRTYVINGVLLNIAKREPCCQMRSTKFEGLQIFGFGCESALYSTDMPSRLTGIRERTSPQQSLRINPDTPRSPYLHFVAGRQGHSRTAS